MYISNKYRNLFNLNPPLQVIRQPYKDKQKEKMRNRFPLAMLIRQTPKTYMVTYKFYTYLLFLLHINIIMSDINT